MEITSRIFRNNIDVELVLERNTVQILINSILAYLHNYFVYLLDVYTKKFVKCLRTQFWTFNNFGVGGSLCEFKVE